MSDLGTRKGDHVGLFLDKQATALTGIYGVLKAGAAYVPLDPLAPVSRLGYIARDCELRVVVTGVEKAQAWQALVDAGAPLDALVVVNDHQTPLDGPPGVAVARLADAYGRESTPHVDVAPDDVAYILYTSGSTGAPKGVVLSHRNGLAFVDWAVECFAIDARDCLSSHAPLHFDLSIFDVFAAARAGAEVALVPPVDAMFPRTVARFIADNGVTVWYSVPTALIALATKGGLEHGAFPRLRVVLFAGEVFPPKYLRQLMQQLPHARFYNLFGPTETNVCTYYEIAEPPADDETIPIGRPIADVDALVLGEDGRIAEQDVPGELVVHGPTVMRGYWGDPERTSRVLVPDPLGSVERVYRTGDLVTQRDDGVLLFHGRRDTQIKSRGYRIELGEIEAALHAHPSVVEGVVLAVPDELVTNRIHAVVVAAEDVADGELDRFCAARLPAYMVPERFSRVAALPRTSTGKIDREAVRASLQRGAT